MVHKLPLALIGVVGLAAAAAPSLLAYNVSPSPTFLNQALACALWGLFVLLCVPRRPGRGSKAVVAALLVLALGVLLSWWATALPVSLVLSALALLAATTLLLLAGDAAGQARDREELLALFCWAWVLAGVLNLMLAWVQSFQPGWADGRWIAIPNTPSRAMGNLRQPNHLSSLFMWASVAVTGLLLLRRLAWPWAWLLMAGLLFGVVLTASRTGGLSVALLALWGLLDRRLPRQVRLLLLAAPLLYALAWWGMSQWAAMTNAAFGGEQRLAEADISGSRFAIWSNTWSLILQQPWLGVGFGNFNLAWTLTPFPNRPLAYFDHSHNLPLQLAAELGLPAALLVMGLLLGAVLHAAWRSLQKDKNVGNHTGSHTGNHTGALRRCALMMVLMIALHSLLEYPLWYAYFLLPAAWALGWACAKPGAEYSQAPLRSGSTRAGASAWALAAAALVLTLGSVLAVLDYRRVAHIYYNSSPLPLWLRIANGQRSLLFSHHADYAAATSDSSFGQHMNPAFDQASRYLLDTRLMIAWSRALNAQGDKEAARHVAARLREFRKTEAQAFFAACPLEAMPVNPIGVSAGDTACELPGQTLGWRQFLKTAR